MSQMKERLAVMSFKEVKDIELEREKWRKYHHSLNLYVSEVHILR